MSKFKAKEFVQQEFLNSKKNMKKNVLINYDVCNYE